MKQAQGSVELLVLMGFMFIAVATFFVVIEARVRAEQQASQHDLHRQLADLIETELQLASRVEIGFMREFDVPKTLGAEAYNLTYETGNAIVIKGNLSQNEYIRFLNINFSILPPSTQILVPGSRRIILERVPFEVLIRRDCVIAGLNAESCPRS